MLLFAQFAEAYMEFMSNEQLVQASEYIVVAKVKTVSHTGKIIKWDDLKVKVVKNELQVIELIKGSLPLAKPFVLMTFDFGGLMEDNVELPPIGSKVLLFLEKDKKGKLKPVNGIQGVWKIDSDGKPIYGIMKEIRVIVQKQKISCSSKKLKMLLDRAKTQTEAGHHREALESYHKAYGICPMRDLEDDETKQTKKEKLCIKYVL